MPALARTSGVADPRQLQQMRRADRAGGEDHLARRIGDLDPAAAREHDAGGARAAEQHAVHQRAGDDLQVRAALTPASDRSARRWRGAGRRGSAGTSRCCRRRRAAGC